MKPKQDQGSSTPVHHRDTSISMGTSGCSHFAAGWRGGPGRRYLLASVAGSVSMMAVVMAVLVETMGRMAVLAVNTYTDHPSHRATVMVMANDSWETQAPAMEESRPGLSDSVSLHVMLL